MEKAVSSKTVGLRLWRELTAGLHGGDWQRMLEGSAGFLVQTCGVLKMSRRQHLPSHETAKGIAQVSAAVGTLDPD